MMSSPSANRGQAADENPEALLLLAAAQVPGGEGGLSDEGGVDGAETHEDDGGHAIPPWPPTGSPRLFAIGSRIPASDPRFYETLRSQAGAGARASGCSRYHSSVRRRPSSSVSFGSQPVTWRILVESRY